ncbi:MAG: SRPBCC domain-containing protein [Gaiellaceae bacterium]
MEGTCGVRLTRYYRASPSEVWAALTEAASIARWLAPVRNVDLAPGGGFELEREGGVALTAGVRVVEIERLLELDWAAPGERSSVVRFELSPDGDGTVLALDHRRIDARVGMRAMSRWQSHLERLDALLGEAETR